MLSLAILMLASLRAAGADYSAAVQAPPTQPGDLVLEALPPAYQARLASRDRSRARLPAAGQPAALILNTLKRWPSGSVLKVAFLGGDDALRAEVASAARGWLASSADLKLDFGEEGPGGFRSWTTEDRTYAADIRISFTAAGYWSLVGTDCRDPTVVSPRMASMNFQDFDRGLPVGWKGIVLHEFGHALGCEHEHQGRGSGCEDVFRWDDDAGYLLTLVEERAVNDENGRRPGLYTMLAHAPNFWPPWQVDHNLRRLPPSTMTDDGRFDARSIMKYWFPASMFRDVNNSCFTPFENQTLSRTDLERIALFYPPRAQDEIQARDALIHDLLEREAVPDALRRGLQGQSDRFKER